MPIMSVVPPRLSTPAPPAALTVTDARSMATQKILDQDWIGLYVITIVYI